MGRRGEPGVVMRMERDAGGRPENAEPGHGGPAGDDENLMLRFCAGEVAAFDRLFERHGDCVYRYLVRRCTDRAVADDLFQDVWLKLVRARHSYCPAAGRFVTWLFRIAHNCVVDHYRHRGREQRCLETDGEAVASAPDPGGRNPETVADLNQRMERLLVLVERLPAVQREAFLLRHEAGLSVAEIAGVTGVGVETAKSRLRYAMNSLRAGLRDPGETA